ncbi:hypothetical protein [Streptomyces sp. NPDC050287]
MLALTTGEERGAAEWQELFFAAEFALDRIVPARENFSIVEARLL